MTRENKLLEARNNHPRSDESYDLNPRAVNSTIDNLWEDIDSYDPEGNAKIKIPTGVEREGFTYHLGRYSARGEEDSNHETLLKKRYQIVPSSRATFRQKSDVEAQSIMAPHHIAHKDCIWYERPTAFRKKDDAYAAKLAYEQMTGVSRQISDESRMPNNAPRNIEF